MVEDYEPPEFKKDAFYCRSCQAISGFEWMQGYGISKHTDIEISGLQIARCTVCKSPTLWIDKELVYPRTPTAPLPAEDMPDQVKETYEEARKVVSDSPRAAGALLRLSLEHLLEELGAEGGTNYEMIGDLVDKGEIQPSIQRACDFIRVIGNESVHPGQLDLEDDRDSVLALFSLINTIIRTTITREKEIEEMYEKIPDSKKDGIENRDS